MSAGTIGSSDELINVRDQDDFTALHYAVKNNKYVDFQSCQVSVFYRCVGLLIHPS